MVGSQASAGCHLISSTIPPPAGQKEPFELKLYPNPVLATGTDYLNVYFDHPNLKDKAIFQLIDASGKVLLEFESTMGDITHMVPISNLVSGTYWLTCRVGEDVVTKQVVVQ